MYKLYNVKAWGSLGPHCVLEELEVPFQNVWLTPEQVRAPEFREINPLGFIPVLGLPDGHNVIESAAIISYLTVAHPEKSLSPKPGSLEHAMFLSLLHFMSTNIYPALSLTYGNSGLAMSEAHDAFIVERSIARSHELFGLVEEILRKEGPWLLGETFSALDSYLFMLTLWAKPNEADLLQRFPNIARLVGAIRQRPKLKAVLEAHGVLHVGGYGS
jgi:glutathione S-transferase